MISLRQPLSIADSHDLAAAIAVSNHVAAVDMTSLQAWLSAIAGRNFSTVEMISLRTSRSIADNNCWSAVYCWQQPRRCSRFEFSAAIAVRCSHRLHHLRRCSRYDLLQQLLSAMAGSNFAAVDLIPLGQSRSIADSHDSAAAIAGSHHVAAVATYMTSLQLRHATRSLTAQAVATRYRGAAVQRHRWPTDLTLSLAAQAVAARYRGAAGRQYCWPPDLTLSLAAQAGAARYRVAAVQQHRWPTDLTLSLAAQAGAARYRGAAVQTKSLHHRCRCVLWPMTRHSRLSPPYKSSWAIW